MRLLYVGDYDPSYSRHRVLLRGLRLNGVTVTEQLLASRGIKRYLGLIRAVRRYASAADVTLVPYSNSRLVWLAKLAAGRRPVAWDAFYSLYDTFVHDRQLVRPWGIRAGYYWLLDWLCARTADLVLVDTPQHAEYFASRFGVPRAKLVAIPVGADDTVFSPRPAPANHGKLTVLFYGKYVPLQGTRYIVEAAAALGAYPDVQLKLIGSGQTYTATVQRAAALHLSNVSFVGRVPYGSLPDHLAEADIVLGIFGDTDKTTRVVPNKVYEAAAMAKPIITADTPAIRQIFTDRQSILLCRRADGADLAAKILELRSHPELRQAIGQGAHAAFSAAATPRAVGQQLVTALSQLHA